MVMRVDRKEMNEGKTRTKLMKTPTFIVLNDVFVFRKRLRNVLDI
jgi:hypothetical protein